MHITVLLYDGFTATDCIGPHEVLASMPDATVEFVAREAGIVYNDTRSLGAVAARGIDEITATDVLLIPGGPGDRKVREDQKTLEWIRQIDKTTQWTTSVCTGSLILGAAGLLKGKRATSYWARRDMLAEFGATPVQQRWVEDGKIITGAGVSAGIDMALYLVSKLGGQRLAEAVQLGIEYDPQPPFNMGSDANAPENLVKAIRAGMESNFVELESKQPNRLPASLKRVI